MAIRLKILFIIIIRFVIAIVGSKKKLRKKDFKIFDSSTELSEL